MQQPQALGTTGFLPKRSEESGTTKAPLRRLSHPELNKDFSQKAADDLYAQQMRQMRRGEKSGARWDPAAGYVPDRGTSFTKGELATNADKLDDKARSGGGRLSPSPGSLYTWVPPGEEQGGMPGA